MSNLHRPRKPHAIPVRPASTPPPVPPIVFHAGLNSNVILPVPSVTLTADEARQIVALIDGTRYMRTEVAHHATGVRVFHGFTYEKDTPAGCRICEALDSLPPALLARLRGAAGTEARK